MSLVIGVRDLPERDGLHSPKRSMARHNDAQRVRVRGALQLLEVRDRLPQPLQVRLELLAVGPCPHQDEDDGAQ